MNWPQAVTTISVIAIIAYSAGSGTPPPPARPPCVALAFFPEIDGFNVTRIHETVVFIDAPVFDRLFAGCEHEADAILAATPDNVVRAIRRTKPL